MKTFEQYFNEKPEILPHSSTYTRVGVSKIPGASVGVFAIRPIPKSILIFSDENTEIIWLSHSELKKKLENEPDEIKQLYDDFCVVKGDQIACPVSFNHLSPAWYLNHSKNPNVGCDENLDFFCFT